MDFFTKATAKMAGAGDFLLPMTSLSLIIQTVSGLISISSSNPESMQKAKEIITNLTSEVEVGKVYAGRVVSTTAFGAFVEIMGKEGLCHISELAHHRAQNVTDVVKEGDKINVKVLDVNDRGQIKLSLRATLPMPT